MANGAPDPILKTPGGVPFKVFIDISWSSEMARRLISASHRLGDYGPLLRAIGRKLVLSTRKNIIEQRSPDGKPWARLKRPRGRGRNPGSKALFDTGRLYESITYEMEGADAVAIGYPHATFYGRFHQEGTKFIPARPFLGIRPDDLPTMQQMLGSHAQAAFTGTEAAA